MPRVIAKIWFVVAVTLLTLPTVFAVPTQERAALVGIQEIGYPAESTDIVQQRHQELLNKAIREGSMPVIVRLRLNLLPEARLNAPGIQQQRERLAQVQERVLNRLSAIQSRSPQQLGVKRFTLTPALAIHADEQMLQELLADPNVLNIVEDELNTPSLHQSVPLIGGDSNGIFANRTGQGWVVAVLDTGVEKPHPFLSGKVVSEACYSTTWSGHNASSLCPGGVSSSTAPGSGVDCASNISGCGHGTHVAGIAAGRESGFSGVAKDAGIIAIQVFSRFDSTTHCGSSAPCVLAYSSDIIQGLERVFALRSSHQIAVANMSLGGGRYYSHCDGDSRKPVIDQLRAVGIATVIASGNNGYTDSIGAPACISSAVSVGSTTKSDIVSSFSNSASFLDVLAPGSSINSSVLNGQYAYNWGTSMAAPHVAGAWAVMKQAQPNASVDQVLNALINTGEPVVDTRTGAQNRVKPRIQVDQAVYYAIPPPPTSLTNGLPVTGLSGTQSSERYFYIKVPAGASDLEVTMSGGTGDADLYVRFDSLPTLGDWDCRPYLFGNEETCTFDNPAGTYYIMLHGWSDYSGVTLTASYSYTCPYEDDEVLHDHTVTGVESHGACRTITAGPAFTVESSGHATFTAGQRITLRPGFRVQAGGRFNARIDTALATTSVAPTSMTAESHPLTEPQYASPLARAAAELEYFTPAATALTWSELPQGLRERLNAHDARIREAQYSEAGQVISFATEAALVGHDDNDYSDIYLYEMDSDRLTLISTNLHGQAANAPSTDPRLAADGQTVIYRSTATDLVSGTQNAYNQLYQYDRLGTTTRLTVTATGHPGNGDTSPALIAGDWIIYTTQATNLGSEGRGLYRQHLYSGQRELIGLDHWGQPDPQASQPTATADGEQIAYQRPEQQRWQILLHDLLSVERISLLYDPVYGLLDHCCAALSADGHFIAYREQGEHGPAWLHLLDRDTNRHTRLPWPEDAALQERAPQFRNEATELWWINPEQGLGQPEILHRVENPLYKSEW